MPSRLRTLFFVLPLALAVILVGLMIFRKHPPEKELPFLGKVPSFSLLDNEGKEFSKKNLDAKIRVVNFMFTTCQGICPSLSREMTHLQQRFSRHGTFELLSISVDPENDTPERIKAWAEHKKVDTRNWHFLTGTRVAVKKLLEDGFKIGLPDQPQVHSDRFVLIDQNLNIRGYYQLSVPETLEKLRVDIFNLLRG